jgi:single-strand DNA-binding protein
MSDTISVTGLVATTPRHITTSEGLAITSFRLASSQRRYDRTQQRWIDADTNWYTVSCFRGLATNCAGSVVKGDRVMVSGRLKIRDWENTDRSGTTVEIEADNLGHDLFWGTSTFTRTLAASAESGAESGFDAGVEPGAGFVAAPHEDASLGDEWVAVSA